MCRHCDTLLRSLGTDHPERLCPFQKSQHCPHCAQYGHSLKECARYVPNQTVKPKNVHINRHATTFSSS